MVFSANHGLLEVRSKSSLITSRVLMAGTLHKKGSGSTYVYGYCDATYQEGWGRETKLSISSRTVRLSPPLTHERYLIMFSSAALSLAMSRDGSSGGVIRMCVITEAGVERLFVPGDELPKFWQGHEVLGAPGQKPLGSEPGVAPMVVEA